MYSRFYQLKTPPFENTPDPDFLFPSKSHREVLASLIYGIDNAKGIIVLVGDIGTGKTTLIHALLKDMNPSYIVFNIVNPKLKIIDVVQSMINRLGIRSKGENSFDIMEKFKGKLQRLDDMGIKVVLIIDEAHLLSESTLERIRLLSNLEGDKRKLIQLILAGQNELYSILQRDSLKALSQRIIINCYLEPLSKKEVKNYIEHRLRVAGRRSPLFTNKAITLIGRTSQGLPRQINKICDNALLIGYALAASKVEHGIVREVLKDMDFRQKVKTPPMSLWLTIIIWGGAGAIILLLIFLLSNILLFNEAFFTKSKPQTKGITNYEIVNSDLDKTEPRSGEVNNSSTIIQKKLNAQSSSSSAGLTSGHSNKDGQPANRKIFEDDFFVNKFEVIEHETDRSVRDSSLFQKIVKPQESLSIIAKETYGFSSGIMIDLIQIANPEILDVNKIFPGQHIVLPRINENNFIVRHNKASYLIHYASYYTIKEALGSVATLKRNNDDMFAVPSIHLQGVNLVYRIYLGFFKSRQDAERIFYTLKQKHPFFKTRLRSDIGG